MFKFISNMPIFRRLSYAFLLAAVIPGIVITILGIIFINTQNARSQALETSLRALQRGRLAGEYLRDLKGQPVLSYQDWSRLNTTSIQAEAPQIRNNIRNLEHQFEQAVKRYQTDFQINTAPRMQELRTTLLHEDSRSTLAKEQQQLLSQITQRLWPAYKIAQEGLLDSLAAGTPPSNTAYSQVNQRYTDVAHSWNRVETMMEQISNRFVFIATAQHNSILLATAIAFLITTLLIVAIGYIVNATITLPLRQLAMLTRCIARGETNARARVQGQDELSIVATSMNNILDNIMRLIQETQSQRDGLHAQAEKLVSEVSGVGEGDLSVQAEVTTDTLGVLADSFNYMIEELGSLVVRIKMVAHEVEQSTTTILDRMAQLVETGDAQIKQIAQAAVEVQQMVGSSRQIAKHSQGLYKLSHNTRDNTQNGRDSVIQTISGIGRINQNIQATANKIQTLGEHSREINEIVEVISNIAHQMNRLALDAAIQAAMAGEHGRGFGAVAADIRRMAERTKDQVKMISRIVRSVREDITAAAISMQDTKRETATGTRLTREAGTALESIFSAVEHQAQEIENINAMATQQLQSSSAVVRIMHTFSSYTQKSSISIHEAALHMQRLARLVKQLHTSVETFKLRKDRKYEGPHRHTSTLSDNSLDKSLTVSGVFRTISAIVKPMPSSHTEDITSALSPEQTNDPFAFYPKTPEQAFQDISCIVNSSSPDEEQRAPRAQ